MTYSEACKTAFAGVSKETLAACSVYSEETAREMAQGARRVSGSDIALSVTGIAGPGGATAEKPVGLVYIALADKEETIVKRLNLSGDRDSVRKQTCECVFELLSSKI